MTHPGKCKGPGCNFCKLARESEFHRKLWGAPAPLPCVHEGRPSPPPPGRPVTRTYYQCDAGKGVVCKCDCGPGKCPLYRSEDDPGIPAGVVVGHYGMPRVAELQVRLIRHHCGAVPILVHDDWSPEPARGELDAAMALMGVPVVRSGTANIGHAGGDLGAFHAGLTWAKEKGLRVLVKLSQRFLVDVPNWIDDAARVLTSGRESCLSDACLEGACRLPLRTECIAVDVPRWNKPAVMGMLTPRRVFPNAAEHVVHKALGLVGGGFRAWPLLGGPHRQTRTPGVLWHCNTKPDEYKAMAARFGIELGDDFFVHGWPKASREDWG